MLFSFVVLVKMENRPSIQEWLVIFYIVSTAVEKTREVSVPAGSDGSLFQFKLVSSM